MARWQAETREWPADEAVLFVHGVGDASPGDYDDLVAAFLESVGGDAASNLAVYFLYYDDVNDWANRKVGMGPLIDRISGFLKPRAEAEAADQGLGTSIAEYAGDVLFPLLNEAYRRVVQERYLAQLNQIRLDGDRAHVPFHRQRISIICHSLGCFHTYEALHAAAGDPRHALLPVTNAMRFANVIYMASPVQLIRTLGQGLGDIVPQHGLATLNGDGLFCPSERNVVTGEPVLSTRRWVSITGDLDPIGGHFFKRRIDWAYMDIGDAQQSYVDDQAALNIHSKAELASHLLSSRKKGASPSLPLNDPHSWSGYIARHTGEIRQWLGA